jgi:hypothetical protein
VQGEIFNSVPFRCYHRHLPSGASSVRGSNCAAWSRRRRYCCPAGSYSESTLDCTDRTQWPARSERGEGFPGIGSINCPGIVRSSPVSRPSACNIGLVRVHVV